MSLSHNKDFKGVMVLLSLESGTPSSQLMLKPHLMQEQINTKKKKKTVIRIITVELSGGKGKN